MRIDGEWLLCDDGIIRPVIRGEILTANGAWQQAEFLVDTGADRTVLSAATLAVLGFRPLRAQERIAGLGGVADRSLLKPRFSHSRRGR
jgi:predicted aspartyl protease